MFRKGDSPSFTWYAQFYLIHVPHRNWCPHYVKVKRRDWDHNSDVDQEQGLSEKTPDGVAQHCKRGDLQRSGTLDKTWRCCLDYGARDLVTGISPSVLSSFGTSRVLKIFGAASISHLSEVRYVG